MANTKVTSAVIADNAVGIDQLNVSDGTNGQVLTTNGSGTLSFGDIPAGYTDSDVESYLNTSAIYTDATNDRLGIGTASPSYILDVTGAASEIGKFKRSTAGTTEVLIDTSGSGDARLVFADNGTDSYAIGRDNTNGDFVIAASGALGTSNLINIESTGNVGIGTSSPISYSGRTMLTIDGSTQGGGIALTTGGTLKSRFLLDNSDVFYIQQTANAAMVFDTNATERMRIASDGEIQMFGGNSVQSNYTGANQCIGVYSSSIAAFAISRASVNAGLYVSSTDAGSGNVDFISFHTGTTERARLKWTGSTISLANTSDYRLKENVIDLQNATERLNGLRPVQFDWIDNGSTSEGFIAHEVSDYLPNAVSGTKDEVWLEEDCIDENEDKVGQPKYQQIHREEFIPLLVKALQESNAKIAELEARIETLENA